MTVEQMMVLENDSNESDGVKVLPMIGYVFEVQWTQWFRFSL